jgi:hypothetical protein
MAQADLCLNASKCVLVVGLKIELAVIGSESNIKKLTKKCE